MRSCLFLFGWSAALCLSATAGAGHPDARAYTLVELPPPGDDPVSRAVAVNNLGEVVGVDFVPPEEFGSVLRWDSGQNPSIVVTPPTADPQFWISEAFDINDAGEILVTCGVCENNLGVLTADNELLVLVDPPPPAPGDMPWFLTIAARSMNERGDVMGYGRTALPDETYAIVWERRPGGMVPVVGPVLGPVGTNQGVNVRSGPTNDAGIAFYGSVPGQSGGMSAGLRYDTRTGALESLGLPLANSDVFIDGANTRGDFVYQASGVMYFVDGVSGVTTPIPSINCEEDNPFFCTRRFGPLGQFIGGINAAGTAVGSTFVIDTSSGSPVNTMELAAFVWTEQAGTRRLSDLVVDGSDAGWELIEATDISDTGLIVGNGVLLGEDRAFMLVPRDLCAADTNRDGMVTPADYNAWILSFNNGCDAMTQ